MNKYYPRIADKILDLKLRAFGAVNIVGPKWCGKTRTALEKSKSSLLLQKLPDKDSIIYTASIDPEALLKGEQPRLIDEWQDAPNIWDAIRAYCDENGGQGHFILTGSSSKFIKTKHTGTGRISTLNMHPMSLFESKESNGLISLKDLFDNKESLKRVCISDLELKDLIFAACRGGWPESVLLNDKEAKLAIAKDYFEQIYKKDIFSLDDTKRNSNLMKYILRSYARNVSTLAKKISILNDILSNEEISRNTFDEYIEVLERLFIIDDLDGWSPKIRSKTAIRSGRKREFIDPSIAVAALGGSPEYYQTDLKSFGFIFENLCIRDLKVYSSAIGGELSYYSDNLGLEADAVLHISDGRYALIEFKLGDFEIEKGARNLNKLESLIIEANKNANIKMPLPTLKIVITGTKYGYRREDGVLVIPIGCLKD